MRNLLISLTIALALAVSAQAQVNTAVTITIPGLEAVPGTVANEMVEAFAAAYKYQPFINDAEGNPTVPNPETKSDFMRRVIRTYLRNIYRAWKADQEANIAREAARTTADTFTRSMRVE